MKRYQYISITIFAFLLSFAYIHNTQKIPQESPAIVQTGNTVIPEKVVSNNLGGGFGTIQKISGGGGGSIGGAITGGTQGSVLFLGASGVLAQDNSNFFWDNTNKIFKLGSGTSTFTNSGATGGITATMAGGNTFYVPFTGQNTSSGTTASTDIILGNNNATDTTNYLDLGISSSNNADPLYTAFGANGAYLYSQTGELAIATASAQSIKFVTGGTLSANIRMVIDSTGNVGIGTTSPDYPLSVTGAINAQENQSATDVAYRINGSGILGKTTAGNFPATSGYTRFIGQGMVFSANNDNTIQMAILSSGNVGIGTISPGAMLQVNTSSASTKGIIIKASTSQTARLTEWQNSAGSAIASIDEMGDIITTATFYTNLGVSNTSTGNNAYFGVPATGPYITRNIADTNPALYVRQVHASSTGDILQLRNSANTSLFNVSYTGNVGIGTISPSGRLDVSAGGGTQTAGDLVVDTTNNIVYIGKLDSVSGNTNLIFRDRLGSVKSRWDNAGSGSIGFANFSDGFGIRIGPTISGIIGSIGTLLLVQNSISSSAKPTAIFKAGISQTGDLTQWQNSAGTSMVTVSYAGSLNFKTDAGGSFGYGSIGLNGTQFLFMPGTGGINFAKDISGNSGIFMALTTGNVGMNTTSPNSTTHVNGSFSTAYVAKTANYTATSSDYTIDCTSGTFTVTLPTAVGITGRIYVITNSGAGVITVATTSSQTFVNVTGVPTTLSLAVLGAYRVQSNGANWIVI